MNDKPGHKTIQVALLVVPETAPAVLYTLLELFNSVGTVWESMTGKAAGRVRMSATLVAETTGQMECAMSAPVQPQASIHENTIYDVVMATDMLFGEDFDPRGRWQHEVAWARTQYEAGALVASVCTGSLLLAEAGLLDEGEATTHWGVTPLFNRCYPGVKLNAAKLLAQAGKDRRIITAGGATSWVELGLYLVARYCGPEEASRTSRVFLLGDRSEGQLPFAALAQPSGINDAVIDNCLTWIACNYDLENPVSRMAAQSGLPERTFKRRFREATGHGAPDRLPRRSAIGALI